MKMNSSKMLFLMTMMMGIVMTMSSNNWIMMWCGLEISMVSFMPLMTSNMLMSSEATIKYFIMQSISSSMLMLTLLVMIMKGDYNYEHFLMTALMLKMGVAPFHNWVLTVVEGLEPMTMFILLTINKLAPLTMLSYLMKNLTMIVIITMVISAISGLNQNSLKKLIGYSSVFNTGMLMMIIKVNSMWITYLMIYSSLILMMIVIMMKNKMMFINQMMFTESINTKMTTWMNLLSMGGMPPLMGFSIKYMTIMYLIQIKMMTLMSIMIISSLMIMFFYLRMTFISVMSSSLVNKIKLFNLNETSMIMMTINLTMMPMVLLTKSLL